MIVTLPALVSAAAPDVAVRVDQARLDLRDGFLDDARAGLRAAVADPDGRIDPSVWLLLAEVEFARGDLAAARDAAEHAHTHARTEDELNAASALSDWLARAFGMVTITSERGTTRARVTIEPTSPIVDPKQREWVDAVTRQLSGPVGLPLTVGLPVGVWTISGAPVTVTESGAEVTLSGASAGSPLARATVDLGSSVTFWTSDPLGALLPAVTTDLSVVVPFGVVVVSPMVTWAPVAWRAGDGSTQRELAAPGGGLRVGVSPPAWEPLHAAMSVGYRASVVAGLELACDGADCGAASAPDRYAYGGGVLHLVTIDGAIGLVQVARARWGLDARLGFDVGRGALPAAWRGDDGNTYAIGAERTFAASAVRAGVAVRVGP